MSFTKYAATVKNLRGVVLADLSEPGARESLEWLVKRFHYRALGLTPSMLRTYGRELSKKLSGKPLKELALPVPSLEAVPALLVEGLGLPVELAELLTYSSVYISPAILVGDNYLPQVEGLAVEVVKVCRELDAASWRLHLRIADYTALDFYEACVNEALSVLSGGGLERALKSRLERVRGDAKRYWRVLCREGRPFLYYVDNLRALGAEALKRVSADAAAALSIVPVVCVPPALASSAKSLPDLAGAHD